MIPYEDRVDIVTPINILFIRGGKCGFLVKIKLLLLPPVKKLFRGSGEFLCDDDDDEDEDEDDDDDDDDDHDDCKCGATSGFRSSIWAPDGQIVKTETVQTDTTPFQ